ncbi:MAG: NosD domain-containing protein [Methanomicrobiales archaeon]|nr:NosD domain-containing protein [Methanomicrobiales archaeon]
MKSLKNLLPLCCLFFWALAVPLSFAAELHVPGDYSTIQGAIDAAGNGDTISVQSGTYFENIELDKPVHLIGAGVVVINGSFTGDVIRITGDGCTVEGFHIEGIGKAMQIHAGIRIASNGNTVRNNRISRTGESTWMHDTGIYLFNDGMPADGNTIDNNTIEDTWRGIYVYFSNDNVILNNTIRGTVIPGGEMGQGYGLYLSQSGGNLLYFNEIDYPMGEGWYYNTYDDGTSNRWYSSTLGKGNRYSDYTGVDDNADGVGDTPYPIAGGMNQDLYPLMPVFSPSIPPLIGVPDVAEIGANSARIEWSILNGVPSNNRVLYGIEPDLSDGTWSSWENATTSPSIYLSGLASATNYYFRCHSVSVADEALSAVSATFNFTTLARSPMTITVDDDDGDIPVPPADFHRIQDALDSSMDGDTILVYYGVYQENLVVKTSVNLTGVLSATQGMPQLWGNQTTLQEWQNGDILSLASSGCTVQGLNISHVYAPTWHVRSPSAIRTANTTWRNVGGTWQYTDQGRSGGHLIRDNILEGMYIVSGSNGNTIRDNTIEGGVTVYAASANTIQNNTIRNGTISVTDFDNNPFWYVYPSYQNMIYRNTFELSSAFLSPAIHVNRASDVLIEDNIINNGSISIWGRRNRVTGNTISGTLSQQTAGIAIRNGNDNYLGDNLISGTERGIELALLATPGTSAANSVVPFNVTMRRNRIVGTEYAFGFDIETSHPVVYAEMLDNDIDTSNRIGDGASEGAIYYLHDLSGATLSNATLPDAAYLAVISGDHLLIENFTFTGNLQGILLYDVADSTMRHVNLSRNYHTGLELYNTSEITIGDSAFAESGDGGGDRGNGILIFESRDCTIADAIVERNDRWGIWLDHSRNTTLENLTIRDNRDRGLYMDFSTENLVYNSTLLNTTHGRQDTGIFMGAESGGNLIFNNYFSNSVANIQDYIVTSSNRWNITRTPGVSIIGGPYLGGNYWHDYSGMDLDGDGLGDTEIPYRCNGNIANGGDHLPLTSNAVPDTFPPTIVVHEPRNTTYTFSPGVTPVVFLNVSSPDADVSTWWYRLDGGENTTFIPNITFEGLANGEHELAVAVNDTSGNENRSSITFVINAYPPRDHPVVLQVDDDRLECPGAEFTRIQDAVTASVDSDSFHDTIQVCSGRYTEHVILDRRLDLLATGDVVLESQGEDAPALDISASGTKVEGFTFRSYRYAIRAGGTDDMAVEDVEIRNNTFIGFREDLASSTGIVTHRDSRYPALNTTIEGNRFSVHGIGIRLSGAGYHVAGNVFEDDSIAILLQHGTDTFTGIELADTIEGNDIVNSTVLVSNGEGGGVIVRGNRISWSGDLASSDSITLLSVESWGGAEVEDNTVASSLLGIGGTIMGIRLDGDGLLVRNNTVTGCTEGMQIRHPTYDLTMRENRMDRNRYNFVYLLPEDPDPDALHPDIDPGNTVDGKGIYFFSGATDRVFSPGIYPALGYLACIDCRNISISGFTLSENSQGILLYNTSGARLHHLTAGLCMNGIEVHNSTDVSIASSTATGSHDGILMVGTVGGTIEDCLVETNTEEGIALTKCEEITIANSTIRDNGGMGDGIVLRYASGNVIRGSQIRSTIGETQYVGLRMIGGCRENLVYDNIFQNRWNVLLEGSAPSMPNRWNITRTPGVSIIGGPYLGGNYWHDYSGMDLDGDGLGDTMLPYNASGQIGAGGDYRPLTRASGGDTAPPSFEIISPLEGMTYTSSTVALRVRSQDPDISNWWYRLDGGENVSFVPNTTLSSLSDGLHLLEVFIEDYGGNENTSSVTFRVRASTSEGGSSDSDDGTPTFPVLVEEPDFTITILSPEQHAEYVRRSIGLRFRAPRPLASAAYILDDGVPIAVDYGSTIPIDRLSLGEHRIVVEGIDVQGRGGRGETSFIIRPLDQIEAGEAGAPAYPDDAAYAFMGRPLDHLLTFEAGEISDGEVVVHLNRYLGGIMGSDPILEDEGGVTIGAVPATAGWSLFSFPINASDIRPDAENLISFIHQRNPHASENLEAWKIRNVTITPLFPPGVIPRIQVVPLQKALSPGEETPLLVRIDSAGAEEMEAFIMLALPDGGVMYYPDWRSDKMPISDDYVRKNYFGRLPEKLVIGAGEANGTCVLMGELVMKDSGRIVSLSKERIFFSTGSAVAVFMDQSRVGDGALVQAETAVTGGGWKGNGTYIQEVLGPSGEVKDRYIADMQPLTSRLIVRSLGRVGAAWPEGVYAIRTSLYGEDQNLLGGDLAFFEVCRRNAVLRGTFRTTGGAERSCQQSSISLVDIAEMQVVSTLEQPQPRSTYQLEAPSGSYYIHGHCMDATGNVLRIPVSPVELACGDNRTYDLTPGRQIPPGGGI